MPFDLYLNQTISGVLTGLVYGLSALGLSVIFGVTRIVNFAHGEMMVIGMYLAYLAFQWFGFDPLVSIPFVAAILFAFGYALQSGVINRMIDVPEHMQFLLLAAIAIIISAACLMVFGPDARNVPLSYAYDSYQIGPLLVDKVRVLAGGAAIVAAGLLGAFFRWTRTGKAIRACADNITGARVVGLDVRHLFALSFGLGTACIGAAGCILLMLVDVHPYLSTDYTLLAFVVVIVGGLGSFAGALIGGVLIGVSEALAGLLVAPSLKSMFSFGLLILVLLFRPQGLLGKEMRSSGGRRRRGAAAQSMRRPTVATATPRRFLPRLALNAIPLRGRVLFALLLAALLVAPLVVNSYLLSVLILVLYFAYLGQAWNVMMGFAGQLSLGHALYFGLGAYASAALYVNLGISPWIGMLVGAAIAAVAGAIIGALGFRFRIGGVYFALLTIAFAEFTRILFDHFGWVGGSGGLFLPVANRAANDLWSLRGAPVMFYYLWLAFAAGALILCRALLSSRLGYYWLAIREDEEAAKALGINTFRYKIGAVMLSAALTAVGGVLYAFYYNNLFPESTFSVGRSIDMLLGAVTGGVGTLMGPIIGAFILTPLGEVLTALIAPFKSESLSLDGIKQVFYGICVVLIVMFQRRGVWPYLAAKLRLNARRNDA